MKLTAVIYCVPLGLLVLAMLKLRGTIAFGFAFAAAFLASWGPHAWHLWSVTGNPVFPLYNHVFQSPDWLPKNMLDEKFPAAGCHANNILSIDWTVAQSHVVTELSMRDLRLSIVFVVLALWLGVALIRLSMGKQNNPNVRAPAKLAAEIDSNRVIIFILALVLISYLLWIWMFGIYRYFIVVETLSGICLMIAAAGVLRRRDILTLAVLAGAALTANVVVERPDWGHVAYGARVIDIEVLAAGSLVVSVDDDPNAYLLPFLARDARAVRIDSDVVKSGQSHGLTRRIADIMRTMRAPSS